MKKLSEQVEVLRYRSKGYPAMAMSYLKNNSRPIKFSCFIWAISIFFPISAFPASSIVTIDIYRTDQITVESVKKKCGKQINQLVELLELELAGKSTRTSNKEIDELAEQVTSDIKKMGSFEYVKITPITYPNQETQVTIDLVDVKDKVRIPSFLAKPDKNFPDPNQLIEKWKEYNEKGTSLVFKENRKINFTQCPAHHCVYGFDEKELKPYKNIFNTQVPKNKKKLISILREDKDETKRAVSAFLLAHLKDGKEVVNILTPSFYDSSLLVRNAVMRIFGDMLAAGTEVSMPVEQVMAAIDFPQVAERNKALVMLSSLAKRPEYANQIRKNGLPVLLAQLKLEQKNLQFPAYQILKEISDKDFSETDYKSWEQWVQTIQENTNKN